MTPWDQAPAIKNLACQLGIAGERPQDGILAHCQRRIDSWVAEAGGTSDIDALEALVAGQLQMVFEEIHSIDDFARLKEVYAKGKGEFVFAALQPKFDDSSNPTFGALVQRRKATPSDRDRYVAVIDCRGDKQHRRFFTRWHEIAHRLTTHADGGETEPGYRSEHDPIERLMDEIAAQLGFYPPLFEPALGLARRGERLLRFNMVEEVILKAFPKASFQATLFASLRSLATPILYLEAGLAFNKSVQQKLATKPLFDDDLPTGELRAIKVIPNRSAQQTGFFIPANMRVPLNSIIFSIFNDLSPGSSAAQEDLAWWVSKGKSLAKQPIFIEARRNADRVIAIVQPLSP